MFSRMLVAVFFGVVSVLKAADLELVSRLSGPGARLAAAGTSMAADFSSDGRYVLFASSATDISPAASNAKIQVYLRDTISGDIELISVGPNGAANGDSVPGAISADNRFVVFESRATNLSANETNRFSDIFVRDRTSGTTTQLTVNADGDSRNPQISADGSWIVFQSDAKNLVQPAAAFPGNLFVVNRQDGVVRLLTQRANGLDVSGSFDDFEITAAGDTIVFVGSGTNLVTGLAGQGEIYVAQRTNSVEWPLRTLRSSMQSLPALATASAGSAVLSGNGRYAFIAAAPTTVSLKAILFRVDLTDNSSIVISTNVDRASVGAVDLMGPSVSADGSAAAFVQTNVVRWTASSGIESVTPGSEIADTPVISHNGRFVLYSSSAAIVDGISTVDSQTYLRDMETNVTLLVSRMPNSAPAVDFGLGFPHFSPNDETILFETRAAGLVAQDFNNNFDVLLWNRSTRAFALISESKSAATSLSTPGTSTAGEISQDGRFILLRTLAALDPRDTNINDDVYLYDRVGQTNLLISTKPDGSAAGMSGKIMLSKDGTRAIFESSTTGLAGPNDNRLGQSIYLKNILTGVVTNISPANTNGATMLSSASADFRFIFYSMRGVVENLYRFDSETGERVMVNPANIGLSGSLHVSSDGSRAAFVSSTQGHIYVRDFSQTNAFRAATGTVAVLSANGNILASLRANSLLVTNFATGEWMNFPATLTMPAAATISLSADGRIIAYTRADPAITGKSDVYFYDRLTGEHRLVSRTASGAPANAGSDRPTVSADGRFIAFSSIASDIAGNDRNSMKDVFAYDRATDKLTLLSHRPGSSESGNFGAIRPVLSGDSSKVLFASVSSDLSENDVNQGMDFFLHTLDLSLETVDLDSDSLPDWWEQISFSTLQFTGAHDFDGDGANNHAEFLAGTDPTSEASAFILRSVVLPPDGARQILWSGVPGSRYVVQYKGTAAASEWTNLTSSITASEQINITADSAVVTERYYRVRLDP